MRSEEILRLASFAERIAELTQDLRDEPNHNSNHMASMYAGELDGVRWAAEEIRPLIEALVADREALRAALGTIAGFAYGCPVDKTFDAREALAASDARWKGMGE